MTRIFTQEELGIMFEKYQEPNCWSYQQIADLFGVTKLMIARLIGKTFIHKNTLAENNGNHVLTREDVIKMRELYYTTDLSYQDIAIEFGVAKSTALRAIKKQNWKSVE